MTFWSFVLAYGIGYFAVSLAFEAIKWGWQARKKRIAESDAAHVEQMCIDRRHADEEARLKKKAEVAILKAQLDEQRRKLAAATDRNREIRRDMLRAMSESFKAEDLKAEALKADSQKWLDKAARENEAFLIKKLAAMSGTQLYFAALAQILSGEKSNALVEELTRRSKP